MTKERVQTKPTTRISFELSLINQKIRNCEAGILCTDNTGTASRRQTNDSEALVQRRNMLIKVRTAMLKGTGAG